MPDSFTFILSHINPDINKPINIIDNHTFRRANKKEIKKIKEAIFKFFPNNYIRPSYEQTFSRIENTNKQKHINLDENDWRYWVVSFRGNNDKIEDLSLAASLLENDLEFGFTLIGDLPEIENPYNEYTGFIFNNQELSSFFDSKSIYRNGPPKVTTISEDEIREIRIIYQTLINRNEECFFLDTALQRWKSVKSLPRDSDLMIIGLLSIVECLITHKPTSNSDPSINHQIKTKIPLLSRRFKRPLKYELFSKEVNEDTIWKTIYNYRSNIVHGSKKSDKVPQILNDKKQVINFLKEATKLLILLALSETNLVSDLKQC